MDGNAGGTAAAREAYPGAWAATTEGQAAAAPTDPIDEAGYLTDGQLGCGGIALLIRDHSTCGEGAAVALAGAILAGLRRPLAAVEAVVERAVVDAIDDAAQIHAYEGDDVLSDTQLETAYGAVREVAVARITAAIRRLVALPPEGRRQEAALVRLNELVEREWGMGEGMGDARDEIALDGEMRRARSARSPDGARPAAEHAPERDG